MQTENTSIFREMFLRGFAKELIKAAYKPSHLDLQEIETIKEYKQRKLEAEKYQKGLSVVEESVEIQKSVENKTEKILEYPVKIVPKKSILKGVFYDKKPIIRPQQMPILNLPIPQQPFGAKQYQKPDLELGRVNSMLGDPTVTGIECPGPMKNLVVNRRGRAETTDLSLSSEEIDVLMKEISEKTRIPLIYGVFKAVYQGLLITAVVSEFV